MAKKNNNIHEITIKIEGEEWQKALDESFKKKVKNLMKLVILYYKMLILKLLKKQK